MIPQAFIQDLLNRVDIVDVVSRDLKLKKAGHDFVACCPFHSEKTPSFTVSQAKQFYHCFGCGAHGTAISFLMEHEGLGFRESVESLAQQAGLKLPSGMAHEKKPEQSAQLMEIVALAAKFYRRQLKQSETAISYLKSRGVTGESAARFGLGYAPAGWQNLMAVFPDYQHPALLQAGLVIDSEGRRYDRFRNRVMFPITNHRGAVIAFGGRVLDEDEPKYLNSPETPLFEKGRELYGLFQARRAHSGTAGLIVVEGYLDVLMLAQHGVANVVATLGTATTSHQAQKLLRQSDELVFCFDGDAAGKRAAWRALESVLPLITDGKQIVFLFLPSGHDPDSFIREFGREKFDEQIRNALPLSEFLVRELGSRVNLRSDEGRAALLHSAKPLMQCVKAPAYGVMLRKRLAEAVGLTRAELDAYYRIKPLARPSIRRESKRQPPSLRRRLLQCLLAKPKLAAQLNGGDLPGDGADVVHAVLEFLRTYPQVTTTAGIVHHFSASPHGFFLQEIELEIAEHWNDDFDVETEFASVVSKLEAMQRRLKIEALLEKPQWSAEDKAHYRSLVPAGKG